MLDLKVKNDVALEEEHFILFLKSVEIVYVHDKGTHRILGWKINKDGNLIEMQITNPLEYILEKIKENEKSFIQKSSDEYYTILNRDNFFKSPKK